MQTLFIMIRQDPAYVYSGKLLLGPTNNNNFNGRYYRLIDFTTLSNQPINLTAPSNYTPSQKPMSHSFIMDLVRIRRTPQKVVFNV